VLAQCRGAARQDHARIRSVIGDRNQYGGIPQLGIDKA
jgi:hypothetical protein